MKQTGFLNTAFVLFSLIGISLLSCGDDVTEQHNELLGYWTVTKALQNGSQTNRLDGIFLEFSDESKAKTNFNPELEPHLFDFRVRKEQIVLESNGSQIVFQIIQQTDNVLILSSKLMDFDFELHMEQKAE